MWLGCSHTRTRVQMHIHTLICNSFPSLRNRHNFLHFQASGDEHGAQVMRDGLDANPVARDSRSVLASCFALACKTQNNNACSAGYSFPVKGLIYVTVNTKRGLIQKAFQGRFCVEMNLKHVLNMFKGVLKSI